MVFLSKKRTLEILEKAKPGDKTSQYSDLFLSTLIILNLLAVSLESVEAIGTMFRKEFYIFEVFSVSIFVIEYILRIWATGARSNGTHSSAFKHRLKYIFSFTGLIDLLAILPSLLPLLFSVDLRWLRVLRLLRLLKISHYSTALEDLFSAINHERSSFAAASYLFILALFFASSLMYVAENSIQPDKFSSIPETMWWSLITLTTVGYGDVSPISPLGKIIGAFTAVMGVFSVALLTGIVANAFAHQVAQRKAILEAEIEYRRQYLAKQDGKEHDFTAAFDELRRGVDLSLNLAYNEPWGQMQPVRHILGALLLEQGHVEEAEEVYRADIKLWKDNMWGLLGLKLCLEARGDTSGELEEVTALFNERSSRADIVPAKTCFCAQDALEKSCCD